eukprot:TRINITY_DN20974_c0_g1_i1.p1 TRINITY_DN20974_c0_g1~~TRINITY_DN20974_c0_g1_i1.p1  ORF type:complete len:327 (+),score=60.15 TRINITY_DN20974_c0_g1_i1:56-1036(+)
MVSLLEVGPPALLETGSRQIAGGASSPPPGGVPTRAEPNAVVAAVAAAPSGSVEATVLSDEEVIATVFREADNKRLMSSAWKITQEYLRVIGKKGLVTDVSPVGTVRIAFEGPTFRGGLWFPAGAIAQFLLPSVGQQQQQPDMAHLISLVSGAPHSLLSSTLIGLVRSYPQLLHTSVERLQSGQTQQVGGYSGNRSALSHRAQWSSTLSDLGSPGSPMVSSPIVSPTNVLSDKKGKGLDPNSPPFRTNRSRTLEQSPVKTQPKPQELPAGLETPPLQSTPQPSDPNEVGPASTPVTKSSKSPRSPEDAPWDGISIVSKVIDDIFQK